MPVADIACATLNDIAGLSGHRQLRRVDAMAPTGPIDLPAAFFCWTGETQPALSVPAPGVDSSAIRAAFSTIDYSVTTAAGPSFFRSCDRERTEPIRAP